MNGSALRVGLVAACGFPAPRGSQVLVDEMAIALAHAGTEAHLIAPSAGAARARRPYTFHPSSGARSRALPVSGAPVWLRSLFDAGLIVRVADVVRREKLSVLHAHNYEGLAAALVVKRLWRIPVVYHSHNVLADELPSYSRPGLRWAARRLGAWCDRLLPRMADQVVALSSDVAEYLLRHGVSPDRLHVIVPGIDPAPFAGRPPGERRRRIVFSGNLDRYQNLDLLFDAWALASASDPTIDLTLITHAPTRGIARRIARRGIATRVRVVGARSIAHVAHELSRAMVGVSPRSSWSGFPIKTLNYMASGLATVALAASAKGVVHGETGWVVREPMARELSSALLMALSEPEASKRRGKRALEALREEHSWERLAPRLLEVAERALT
jgi:glycosyltransferase involved in cell wall biosynthesis